jgi:hypothetical protein
MEEESNVVNGERKKRDQPRKEQNGTIHLQQWANCSSQSSSGKGGIPSE